MNQPHPFPDSAPVPTLNGQPLPVIGTLDAATGRISLNPLGMVLLLSKPKRKPGAIPADTKTSPKTEV